MRLIDDLVSRAAAADAKMGQIADREEARERRRAAYAALERELDRMASDGQLDQKEIQQLMTNFRAQGLDTTTLEEMAQKLRGLDSTASVEVTGELREKLSEQLRDAKADTKDPSFHFEAQELMNEYQQSFDLASRVSKLEHDTYMASIRNLVA